MLLFCTGTCISRIGILYYCTTCCIPVKCFSVFITFTDRLNSHKVKVYARLSPKQAVDCRLFVNVGADRYDAKESDTFEIG